MLVSVIIPVWNGAGVISDCLTALYAHSGPDLQEVIAVDNASPDGAGQVIREHFPQVRWLPQPINLGFAGGVNAGLRAANGEVLVLLNQDCLVQPGWLNALIEALSAHPEMGLMGGTLFNADGSINHAGAELTRPEALGRHLTDRGSDQVRRVDYVTGALMAIRRTTWKRVGPLDDGFYPAYYEEVDYCYRARLAGLETGYVPRVQAQHLFSSREWQHDPIKHLAMQQHSRYRFVSKHFDETELPAFFTFEAQAIEAETSFEMNVARILGSRDTLQSLPDIALRCQHELDQMWSPDRRRLLYAGFTRLLRKAFAAAEATARSDAYLPDRWLGAAGLSTVSASEREALLLDLKQVEQREQDILRRTFFTDEPSPGRSLARRLISLATGREHRLLTELNVLHIRRLESHERLLQLQADEFARLDRRLALLDRRLALLETLMDYDYR